MAKSTKTKKPAPIKLDGGATFSVRPDRAPRDGRWYWRDRLPRPSRKTIWSGWATAAEAVIEATRALADHAAERQAEAAKADSVGRLLERWMAHQEARAPHLITERTVEVYKNRVERLRDRLEDVPLDVMSTDLLRRFVLDRLNEGGAPRTVDLEQQVLRFAWRWGLDHGLVPYRTLAPVQVKKDRFVRNHRTPSDAEIQAVLGQLDENTAMVIEVLVQTGARVGEVCGVDLGIDPRQGTLRLVGKTGPRTVPLSADLPRDLVAYLDARPQLAGPAPLRKDGTASRRPANEVNKRLADAFDAAGVERFTCRGLRRAMVRRLRPAGVDVKTAAALMGHSEVVMLRLYVEASPDDIRAAVARASAAFTRANAPSKVVNGPWDPGTRSGTHTGSQEGSDGAQR